MNMSGLEQSFSTFSLKAAKSRVTTSFESRTKEILRQFNSHVLFFSRTKSVTQIIRGFIERLLRAAQRVPGNRIRSSEPSLRTTRLVCCSHVDVHADSVDTRSDCKSLQTFVDINGNSRRMCEFLNAASTC